MDVLPVSAREGTGVDALRALTAPDRRTSTASRRPCSTASSVPSRNRSSSTGRTRSRADEPSSTVVNPRTTATGQAPSLPFTRSPAPAISSATATSVTASSLP